MCVCVFVTWSLASKNRIVDLPSINDIKGGADVLRYVERKVVVPWLPLPLSKQSTMGTEIFGLTPWDGCYPPASSTQAPVAGETGCISGIAALWKIDRSPWSICGLQLDTHCISLSYILFEDHSLMNSKGWVCNLFVWFCFLSIHGLWWMW